MSESIEEYAARLAANRGGVDAVDKPDDKRLRFVEYVAEGHTFVDAAKMVGITYQCAWKWRKAEPEFEEAVQAARKEYESRKEEYRAEVVEGLADKALRVLNDLLDGRARVSKEQMTVAIFVAKSKLGFVETTRVESDERVTLIDNIPDRDS